MTPAEWIASLVSLVAAGAVWRWRHWKSVARRHKEHLAVWKEALHAMAFESTNAVNAIRAHLADFRQVNPNVAMPEHLDQIAAGTERIASILRVADDPVSWHRRREGGAPASQSASGPAVPMIGSTEPQ